ncbi:MAG: DUF5663 domain-containing protein [Candidatus Zambryskibacteria bacterium]|nr:DUF5663 domain-containing protein [Candidatus Zambryskibacteria bacterium]
MNPLSKDVIVEWGLGDLPLEEQIDMVDRIGRLIYQAVLVRSLDILSEVEQVEFDLLLDEDTTTPQEVVVFLESKIPTFKLLLKEEINKLKMDILV